MYCCLLLGYAYCVEIKFKLAHRNHALYHLKILRHSIIFVHNKCLILFITNDVDVDLLETLENVTCPFAKRHRYTQDEDQHLVISNLSLVSVRCRTTWDDPRGK